MEKFEWAAAVLGLIGVACVFSGGIGLVYVAPPHFDGYGNGIESHGSPYGLVVLILGLVALAVSWAVHRKARR